MWFPTGPKAPLSLLTTCSGRTRGVPLKGRWRALWDAHMTPLLITSRLSAVFNEVAPPHIVKIFFTFLTCVRHPGQLCEREPERAQQGLHTTCPQGSMNKSTRRSVQIKQVNEAYLSDIVLIMTRCISFVSPNNSLHCRVRAEMPSSDS